MSSKKGQADRRIERWEETNQQAKHGIDQGGINCRSTGTNKYLLNNIFVAIKFFFSKYFQKLSQKAFIFQLNN
jgi:hypothetical protein